MSIFEKTKHCTKRFPCRFKLAMMVFSAAVIVSIITVPFIHSMACTGQSARDRSPASPHIPDAG
jgi:hypothetical protein